MSFSKMKAAFKSGKKAEGEHEHTRPSPTSPSQSTSASYRPPSQTRTPSPILYSPQQTYQQSPPTQAQRQPQSPQAVYPPQSQPQSQAARSSSPRQTQRQSLPAQKPVNTRVASVPKFPYDNLDGSAPFVRIVELDTEAQGIKCQLKTVRLDNAPPFEALSYCWGPSHDKSRIQLNGKPFEVNSNLYSALLMLKSVYSFGEPGSSVKIPPKRTLWIDAICINQDDLDERAAQVRWMWRIYSYAVRVLVWLGDGTDNGEVGMEMVRLLSLRAEQDLNKQLEALRLGQTLPSTRKDISEYEDLARLGNTSGAGSSTAPTTGNDNPNTIHMFAMGGNYQVMSGPPPNMQGSQSHRPVTSPEEESQIPFVMLWAIRSTSNAPDPEAWVAFDKLMQRPWWSRVWVIQEVAAATDNRVLVGCGQTWLEWDRFMMASHTISSYRDRPGLERLYRLGRNTRGIDVKVVMAVGKDGRHNSWNGLLNLLFSSSEYQATDPRDRIFALLGFAPAINITPNYRVDVDQMYQSVVRQSIENTRNLGILILNRQPKSRRLPSWCPDFSLSLPDDAYNVRCPLGFFGADGNNWHNQGAGSVGCVISQDEPGQLTLQGFTYDNPMVLGPVWSGNVEDRVTRIFDTLEQYERLMNETDKTHFPDRICHHRTEEFWRTLIWNATSADRYPVNKSYGQSYKELREKTHYVMPIDNSQVANTAISTETHGKYRSIPVGKATVYYEALVRNALNRCFFITSKGHLGSGPPGMKPTDQICIILGSKAPIVLRELGQNSSHFMWIGHAYVHGIMHGEALTSLTAQVDPENILAQKTLSLRKFCIV